MIRHVTMVPRRMTAALWITFIATLATIHGLMATPEPTRHWERLPMPDDEWMVIRSLAEDPEGKLWMMADKSTYRWDRATQSWDDIQIQSGIYLNQFIGGPQTGLYITESVKGEETTAKLHRLEHGTPHYVTDIAYDVSHEYPGVLVRADGRIINWTKDKLRVFHRDVWTEHPANLSQHQTFVFDRSGYTSLYYQGKLHVIDRDGRVEATELDPAITRKPRACGMLGDYTAVVFEYDKWQLQGFDIRDGSRVELPAGMLNEIDTCEPEKLISTPDGRLWIIAEDLKLRADTLFRVDPDGTTTHIKNSNALQWTSPRWNDTSAVIDSNGTLWGGNRWRIHTVIGDTLQQLDPRVAPCPNSAFRILRMSDDTIVISTAEQQLLAYHNGTPLTNTPPLPHLTTITATNPRWHYHWYFPQMTKAWVAHGMLYGCWSNNGKIVAVDLETGVQRYQYNMPNPFKSDFFWVSPSTIPNRAFVGSLNHIATIDTVTGTHLGRSEAERNRVHAIVPVDPGYLVVTRSGSKAKPSGISRHAMDGSRLWHHECRVLNDTTPIAVFGLIVYHDSSSRLHGMDAKTGEMIWEQKDKPIDEAASLQFMPNARHLLDTRNERTDSSHVYNTIVTQRDSLTGERRWSLTLEGSPTSQPPLVDPDQNHVYCALRDGRVVCIDAIDGFIRWQCLLPSSPTGWGKDTAALVDHTGMFLLGNHLGLLAYDGLIYLVDITDGALTGRLQLTNDFGRHDTSFGPERLISGPWVIDDQLIVPCHNDVYSYPVDALIQQISATFGQRDEPSR